MGFLVQGGAPPDDSVSTAKVQDDAITLAKMAGGTDGNLITYDTSGDPAAVATGSSGQVLTSAGAGAAPTFAAGGLTSISNASISAATNFDVTGFDSTLYYNYEVWISNAQGDNDGAVLELETSTDGGTSFDTGASDYTWSIFRVDEIAGTSAEADADDAEINVSGGADSGAATNENLNIKISVYGPAATEFTTFTWLLSHRNNAAVHNSTFGSGQRQSAADVDALRFHFSAGDFVAQGKIQFLGIAQ
jgi:hypothetical protein